MSTDNTERRMQQLAEDMADDTNVIERHSIGREENYRLVRVVCSCGWHGRWRARSAFLVEKQLHSDDGEHLYAVRRASQ